VLVVVPAHNEEESLPGVLDELHRAAPQADVVVVNDGSTDATAEVARGRGASVIDLAINLGIGGAVQAGLKYGWRKDYDVCVQVDADGQHDPADLEALLEPLQSGRADCVVGSRFYGSTGYQSTAPRRAGIRILSTLLRIVSGRRIVDITSGYRAMNRSAFGMLARSYPDDYPEPESLLNLVLAGRRVIEVPVTMRPRRAGHSSICAGSAVVYMVKVSIALLIARLRLWFRPKAREQEPLQ
jgi:glycosyltransferase involved in cell wall biosynthesis